MRIGVSFAAGEGLFFRSLFSRAALLELLRALAPEGNAFPRASRSGVYAFFPVLTHTLKTVRRVAQLIPQEIIYLH
jgi:hypothetical protein